MRYKVKIRHGDRYRMDTEEVTVIAPNEEIARNEAYKKINQNGDEFSRVISVTEIEEEIEKPNYCVTITHGDRHDIKTEDVKVTAPNEEIARKKALNKINHNGDEFCRVVSVNDLTKTTKTKDDGWDR